MILPRNVIDSPQLRERLGALRGRWVAIRAGHVVADTATLGELLADRRVKRTDTRMRVPVPGRGPA